MSTFDVSMHTAMGDDVRPDESIEAAAAAAGPPPADMTPWLGKWTQATIDEEAYHRVLGEQGLPWAVRKLLQAFTSQREFALNESGRFELRSRMLTGSWNSVEPAVEPTAFSVLGYTIDTLVTWRDGGKMLVSTCTTSAADGYVLSGWSKTGHIEHWLDESDRLVVRTVTPEGNYLMWMTRDDESSGQTPRSS